MAAPSTSTERYVELRSVSVDGVADAPLRTRIQNIARAHCEKRLLEYAARPPYAQKLLGADKRTLNLGSLDAGNFVLPVDESAGLRLGGRLANAVWPRVAAELDKIDPPPRVGLNLARDDAAQTTQLLAKLQKQFDGQDSGISKEELARLTDRASEGLESLFFLERVHELYDEKSKKALVVVNNGLVKTFNDDKTGVGYNLGCKITDYLNAKARELASGDNRLLVLNYKNVALETTETASAFADDYMAKLRAEYIKFMLGEAEGSAALTSQEISNKLLPKLDPLDPEAAARKLRTLITDKFTFGWARGDGADVKANSAAILARDAKFAKSHYVEFSPTIFDEVARDVCRRLEALRSRMGAKYFEAGDPPVPKLDVIDWVRKYGDSENRKKIPDDVIRANCDEIRDLIGAANVLDFPLISMRKDSAVLEKARPLLAAIERARATGTVNVEDKELAGALLDYFREVEPRDAENEGAESRAQFLKRLSEVEARARFREPVLGTIDIVGLGSINVQESMREIQSPALLEATAIRTPGPQQEKVLVQASRSTLKRGSGVKDNLRRVLERFFEQKIGRGKFLFYVSGGDEFFYIVDRSDMAKLADMRSFVHEELAKAPRPQDREGDIRNAYLPLGKGTSKMLDPDLARSDLERANGYLDGIIAAIKKREKLATEKSEGFLQTASIQSIKAQKGRIVAVVVLYYAGKQPRTDEIVLNELA